MTLKYKIRRTVTATLSLILLALAISFNTPVVVDNTAVLGAKREGVLATNALGELDVKGRAPKTDYSRDQFGGDWAIANGCDTRNIILNRDLTNVVTNDKCQIESGALIDPYTGKTIDFKRGAATSGDIQIDHVVALSDAWQKGAQQLSPDDRKALANDPLELLAADGPANQQKSDGDAATWLPPNKAFRCRYVARQIAVKQKYKLWVTTAEKDAMASVLSQCPLEILPNP